MFSERLGECAPLTLTGKITFEGLQFLSCSGERYDKKYQVAVLHSCYDTLADDTIVRNSDTILYLFRKYQVDDTYRSR